MRGPSRLRWTGRAERRPRDGMARTGPDSTRAAARDRVLRGRDRRVRRRRPAALRLCGLGRLQSGCDGGARRSRGTRTRLQAWRRDLGVDLFVRTTREVKLTDAGRAFLQGARRTLADAERAAEDAKRAAAGELGQLRIAYSWSTRFETLPALGRAFRAGHPDVELLAQEMWNARMPPAFGSGSIDIALSLCPEIAAELELAPIRKERRVALLPEAHPLTRQDAIPLAALADEQFVVFPREIAPRLHDAFMAIYRAPASNHASATSHSTPDGTSASWPRSQPLPWPRKRSRADSRTGSSRSRSANRPTRSRPAWSGAATTARPPSRPS
jgi:LysR substrate binding domain